MTSIFTSALMIKTLEILIPSLVILVIIGIVGLRKRNQYTEENHPSKSTLICALIACVISVTGYPVSSFFVSGARYPPPLFTTPSDYLKLYFLIAFFLCFLLCLFQSRWKLLIYPAILTYGVSAFYGLPTLFSATQSFIVTRDIELSLLRLTFDCIYRLVSLLLLLTYLNRAYILYAKPKIKSTDAERKKSLRIIGYILTFIATGFLLFILFYGYQLFWGRSAGVFSNLPVIEYAVIAIIATLAFIKTGKLPLAVFPVCFQISILFPRLLQFILASLRGDSHSGPGWKILTSCLCIAAILLIAEQLIMMYYQPQQSIHGPANNGKYPYREQYLSQMRHK